MLRRVVFVVVAAMLATGALSANASVEVREQFPWQLVDVSEDGRKVRIVFFYGGCQRLDPQPIALTESTEAIHIAVTGTRLEADPGQQIPCAAIAHMPLRWIKLDRPVAGRRVTGGSATLSSDRHKTVWRLRYEGPGTLVPLIPRTVGLRASDARTLLLRQGFRVRGTRHGTVTSQRPRAGSKAYAHGTQRTVTLHSAHR
jgi:hypothetical protein